MVEAPAAQAPRPETVVVGRPADVAAGGSLQGKVGRRAGGIVRRARRVFGLLNRCPHLGGPLCAGQIVTDVVSPVPGDVRAVPGRVFVTCPWHNWEFDIQTGQSYWNTRLRAMPFAVTVQRTEASPPAVEDRVPGPYQAEQVPVAVEDDVLVLRLRPAPNPAAPVGPCA